MDQAQERLPRLKRRTRTTFAPSGRRTGVWIMGVLNATPDSFYVKSRVGSLGRAVREAEIHIKAGVDVLDIGGESTRPGAGSVPWKVEWQRVVPLIDAIHKRWPKIALSVDTQKAIVAHAALRVGATWINDISAFRHDPAMVDVATATEGPVVLMHMQGTPGTMQQAPRYRNVVDEVKAFFEERLTWCNRHGVPERRVILDPGIGFGKTLEHNSILLRKLSEFAVFGRPIVVGISRKSMIGRLQDPLAEPSPPEERLEGSLAAALFAVSRGAQGLRVHDVRATRRALNVWQSLSQQ